jgi:hypothetical protein
MKTTVKPLFHAKNNNNSSVTCSDDAVSRYEYHCDDEVQQDRTACALDRERERGRQGIRERERRRADIQIYRQIEGRRARH